MTTGSGRPERAIERPDTPAGRLAVELRELRKSAGSPPYRAMARRAHYSLGSLASAARGDHLPTLPVVRAFAEACGGDPDQWQHRWHRARADNENEPADIQAVVPKPVPSTEIPARRRRPRLRALWLSVGAAGLVAACGAVLAPGLVGGANPAPVDAVADRADPNVTNCAHGATVLDHVPVLDLPGPSVGELELRQGGPGCPTAWTRFTPAATLPAGTLITVEAWRPVDGQSSGQFSYANDGKQVFGDMLRLDRGCVLATVLIGAEDHPVASASTRCLG